MLTSIQAKTIPTVISEYVTKTGVAWGDMSAVAVLTVLPVFVLAIIFRRNFVNGLSFGATK
jgi:multiple sugar transport system permease protein